MAITPFRVIQGHRFWYQTKAHRHCKNDHYQNDIITGIDLSMLLEQFLQSVIVYHRF